jgi:hypothetical protein
LSRTSTRLVVKDSPWVATLERWLERDGKPVLLKLGRRRVGIIVSLGNFGAHFAPGSPRTGVGAGYQAIAGLHSRPGVGRIKANHS